MSLNLEGASGLNHVHAVATPGANLSLTAAATTYSSAVYGYTINGVAYNQVIKTTQATPTTDANTGAAITSVANQARVVVWGVNAAGTHQVFAGPVVTWPNVTGTPTGGPIPLQFPSIPSTTAVIAYHVWCWNSALVGTVTYGSTNWTGVTGNIGNTIVNCAGTLPNVAPVTL